MQIAMYSMSIWVFGVPSLTALLSIIIDLDTARCKPAMFVNTRTHQVQACGQHLADILQEYCNDGYNYYPPGESEENTKDGRKKRGITQECCLQPCAHRDLLEYCRNYSPLYYNVSDVKTKEITDTGSDTGNDIDIDNDTNNNTKTNTNVANTMIKRKSFKHDSDKKYDYTSEKLKPQAIITNKWSNHLNLTNINEENSFSKWNVKMKSKSYFASQPMYIVDTKTKN